MEIYVVYYVNAYNSKPEIGLCVWVCVCVCVCVRERERERERERN